MDSAGNLNVVWFDDTTGFHEIFFGRSIDGGQTWSPPKNISDSNNSGKSRSPDITVDSTGKVHVVWRESTSDPNNYEIFYTNSIN